MTDLEFVIDYCRNQYGADPEYPWDDKNFVMRHMDNKKWFLLVMPISVNKLGIDDDRIENVMNLKCDPLVLDSLVHDMPGVYPGYHMNHKYWISLVLDGSIDRMSIIKLINMSYSLTSMKKRKKDKE